MMVRMRCPERRILGVRSFVTAQSKRKFRRGRSVCALSLDDACVRPRLTS